MKKNAPQKEGNPFQNKTLWELKPFIDENDHVCVGRRLEKFSLALEYKHPIIIPRNSSISSIIFRDCHERMAYGGWRTTPQEIWIQTFRSLTAID